MGRTVTELLASMSSRELSEWQAYLSLPHIEERLKEEMKTADEIAQQQLAFFKRLKHGNDSRN